MGLYSKLRRDRWKQVITSDEAWVYLTNCGGKRKIQYITREETRTVCEPYSTSSHPKGVMVWLGISANGPTRPIFVEPGTKINAQYYIKSVLKPFIKEAGKLYPDGNFFFHQDSAPAHTARVTLQFLERNKIKYIQPR